MIPTKFSFSYRCFQCEKIFTGSRRLQNHQLRLHPTADQSLFECDQCDRSFVTDVQLAMHQRIKHAKNTEEATAGDDLIRQYIALLCDTCGHPLDSFSDARFHHRAVHNQNGYLTCCGKKFFKKSRVLQHCEWHIDPRKFE